MIDASSLSEYMVSPSFVSIAKILPLIDLTLQLNCDIFTFTFYYLYKKIFMAER